MPFRPITSREEFERTVRPGVTPESKHLEFKAGYGWQGEGKTREHSAEVCRDVVQFLNTDGGVLVIGMSEAPTANGRTVAGAIKPVENVDGFLGWMEQAIRNYLTPSTFSRDILCLETATGPIVVVNAPPSISLVALWHKERRSGIEYVYRTEHGKQWMNPDEVERHIMNGSRAGRLVVAEAVAQIHQRRGDSTTVEVELLPAIVEKSFDWHSLMNYEKPPPSTPPLARATRLRPVLMGHGERTLSLTIFGDDRSKCLEVPYEFVTAAWVTECARLGLRLDVQLFAHSDEAHSVTMHPIGGVTLPAL